MTEYDINFAAKLATISSQVEETDPWAHDARRVSIYLARLSAEISLKSILEKAGVPLEIIRNRSHNLKALLSDIDSCEVQIIQSTGGLIWAPATLRSEKLDFDFVNITVGQVIDAEDQGASKYPTEIRYGEKLIDFHPAYVCAMALKIAEWAKKYIVRKVN